MKNAVGRPKQRRGSDGRASPGKAVSPAKASAGVAPTVKAGGGVTPASMPKQTTDVDRAVGLRMTALRKAKGLSQTALGQAIGVTFQQVQKYEKGQNRVGAGRLRDIAQLLEVPVSVFFDEEDAADRVGADVFGFLRAPGAIDLLRSFAEIADDQVRRDILGLVRSIARSGGKRA